MATEISAVIAKMRANLAKNAAEVGKTFAEAKKEGEKERLEIFKAMKSDIDAFNKEALAFNGQMDKLNDDLGKAFTAARKEYSDLVAGTKGLTSVKPSVVKALEQFCATLDAKFAREAATNLTKHKDEVLKQSKTNPVAVKFGKDLDKLISNYNL